VPYVKQFIPLFWQTKFVFEKKYFTMINSNTTFSMIKNFNTHSDFGHFTTKILHFSNRIVKLDIELYYNSSNTLHLLKIFPSVKESEQNVTSAKSY